MQSSGSCHGVYTKPVKKRFDIVDKNVATWRGKQDNRRSPRRF